MSRILRVNGTKAGRVGQPNAGVGVSEPAVRTAAAISGLRLSLFPASPVNQGGPCLPGRPSNWQLAPGQGRDPRQGRTPQTHQALLGRPFRATPDFDSECHQPEVYRDY